MNMNSFRYSAIALRSFRGQVPSTNAILLPFTCRPRSTSTAVTKQDRQEHDQEAYTVDLNEKIEYLKHQDQQYLLVLSNSCESLIQKLNKVNASSQTVEAATQSAGEQDYIAFHRIAQENLVDHKRSVTVKAIQRIREHCHDFSQEPYPERKVEKLAMPSQDEVDDKWREAQGIEIQLNVHLNKFEKVVNTLGQAVKAMDKHGRAAMNKALEEGIQKILQAESGVQYSEPAATVKAEPYLDDRAGRSPDSSTSWANIDDAIANDLERT